MTRATFIFIAAVLLLLPITSEFQEIEIGHQLMVCLPFILLLGIPHGAIDNVLFLKKTDGRNLEFIGIYLIVAGINLAAWLFFPVLAYVAFLVLSAYHFGQSQFVHYFTEINGPHKVLHLTWGIALLSGLIFFNLNEVRSIVAEYEDFMFFDRVHQELIIRSVFISSLLLSLLLMIFFAWKKEWQFESLLIEFINLSLILCCFYLMPFIVGFTLYFVILHSIKVMREEYEYLNVLGIISSIRGFLILLTPFSLLSFLGIALLFIGIHFDLIPWSYGYCLMIVISSITLPHAIVMNRFYNNEA